MLKTKFRWDNDGKYSSEYALKFTNWICDLIESAFPGKTPYFPGSQRVADTMRICKREFCETIFGENEDDYHRYHDYQFYGTRGSNEDRERRYSYPDKSKKRSGGGGDPRSSDHNDAPSSSPRTFGKAHPGSEDPKMKKPSRAAPDCRGLGEVDPSPSMGATCSSQTTAPPPNTAKEQHRRETQKPISSKPTIPEPFDEPEPSRRGSMESTDTRAPIFRAKKS